MKAGTILIDASLCEEETSTGRLRFTEAHELSHWIRRRGRTQARGERGAAACRQGNQYGDPGEYAWVRPTHAHANGQAVFLPDASGRDNQALSGAMSEVFQVSRQAMRIRLTSHQLL